MSETAPIPRAQPRPGEPRARTPEPATGRVEGDLDTLLGQMRSRNERQGAAESHANDRIQKFRELLVNELITVFIELVEKYSTNGISMQMDASNFLEGGRELKFEFSLGEFRSQLHGTITSEGVAFHEVKYSPDFHGELTAGPMLRIRHLTAGSFREFICDRLSRLIRMTMRRR